MKFIQNNKVIINLKIFYSITFVLLFSFLLRVIAVYYYGDTQIENEWSQLLNNLYDNRTLSYRSFENNLIPSVYMPPLYVLFLFIIKLFVPENLNFVKTVLSIQIILSIFSIYIFYNLNKYFFTKNWSIFISFILSIFPLEIYAVTQTSSVSLQFFLLTSYMYLFFSISRLKEFSWHKAFLFSLVSSLLMLLRGEFYLIFILTLFYLFFFKKINIKKIIAILLVSLIMLSPYLIRNYVVFNKITLTKSAGYNLWKGNNPFSKIEGAETAEAFSHNNINEKIENLSKDKLYDFNYDQLFLKEALIYIKSEPSKFLTRSIKRFFSYFYFNLNSDYPNYYNPLFIVPIAVTSIFSTFGIIITLRKLNFDIGYLLVYLFSTICIFSLFFILPRYKIIILPAQLIFMNYFFLECYEKIKPLKKLFNNGRN